MSRPTPKTSGVGDGSPPGVKRASTPGGMTSTRSSWKPSSSISRFELGDSVMIRLRRYRSGAIRLSIVSPTRGEVRRQHHLPHLGVDVMQEHDARAGGPQRREERHPVPDLDQRVPAAVPAGELAQRGPGEHHVPAGLADHLVAVTASREPGGPGRTRCASRPRCPASAQRRGDVGRVDLGAAGLDVVEVAPRQHVDAAQTGGRRDVAELLAGLGRVGERWLIRCGGDAAGDGYAAPGRRSVRLRCPGHSVHGSADPPGLDRPRLTVSCGRAVANPSECSTVTPQRLPSRGSRRRRAAVADVEGWMTPGQARKLWDCASGREAGRADRRDRQLPGPLDDRAGHGGVNADVELIAIDPHAGNDRGPQEIEGFEEHAAEPTTRCSVPTSSEAGVVATRSVTCASSPHEALTDVPDGDRPALHRRSPPVPPGPRRHPAVERQGRARRHAAHPRLVQLDRRHRRARSPSCSSAVSFATSAAPSR